LLNIESAEQMANHFAKGALYENLAILELMKIRHNQGIQPSLYFWQDQAGHEIDCIAEWGGQLQAFEIKAGATIQKALTSI
jgi:predicted AAA+ superfamily ATPase